MLLLKEVMAELKRYRVPVANTRHTQENQPHRGFSTRTAVGCCSVGACRKDSAKHVMLNTRKFSRTYGCICSI